MQLLEARKTAYLLNASLESLHVESTEWLKEIEFWQEEISFFYKILRKTEIKQVLPPRELENLDQEMIRISAESLGKMTINIRQHEQELQQAISVVLVGEEQLYRDTHRVLLIEMNHLFQQIREFKKKIFAFVTKYEYLSDKLNNPEKFQKEATSLKRYRDFEGSIKRFQRH